MEPKIERFLKFAQSIPLTPRMIAEIDLAVYGSTFADADGKRIHPLDAIRRIEQK
jgi:hypothetical protein